MKKLFLDDIREPKDCATYMKYNKQDYLEDGWDIVRNYQEFKDYIDNCKSPADLPSLISFDHDLADEHYTPETLWDDYILSKEHQDNKRANYKEKTGEDCAVYLSNYLLSTLKLEDKEYIPKFLIHSMNPVGSDRIRYRLLEYEKEFSNNIGKKIIEDYMSSSMNTGLYQQIQPGIKSPSPYKSPLKYKGKPLHSSLQKISFPKYTPYQTPEETVETITTSNTQLNEMAYYGGTDPVWEMIEDTRELKKKEAPIKESGLSKLTKKISRFF